MPTLVRSNPLGTTVGTVEMESPERRQDHFNNADSDGGAITKDTAMQNTSASAWWVNMHLTGAVGNVLVVQVSPDGTTWTTEWDMGIAATTRQGAAVLVPPNYRYRVTGRGVTDVGALTTHAHRRRQL